MRKQILFALLALVSAIQGMAFDFEVDGIYYTITSSNTVAVSNGTYAYSGDVTVPPSVTNGEKLYAVTSVADNAFNSNSELTSVVLPEGLTTIGESAFQGSGLKSITLPSTLSSMGSNAFLECKSLTGVELPDALTEIKNGAFRSCENLKTMTLGQNTTVIEADAFRKTAITNVFIPKSVKTMGSGSFCENSAMKSLVIDNAAVFIDYDAFYLCTGLETVDLGNAVTGFGYYDDLGNVYGSFRDCTSLTKVVIPATVSQLQATFRGCSRLYDVTLSENLTTIDARAFEGCAISQIELPSSLSTIGKRAFYQCPLTTLNIPSSLNSIGNSAFYKCPLLSITFDENSSLKTIGLSAFYGVSIASLSIPQSVTNIGFEAFAYCNNLKALKIENAAVDIIGSFHDCPLLEEIDLGNKLLSLGDGMEGGSWQKGTFYNCISIKKIALPNSLKEMGNCTFSHCTMLEEVTFNNALISIGHYSFAGCTRLKTITLPTSIQVIGDEAFKGCSGLQTVSLPSSLKTIEGYAFSGCTSLKEVLIPEGLTALGGNAFNGNTALESVVFDNTVVAIPNNAFVNCKSLKNVELGKVTSIGDGAFQACTSLESIVIPNSVESLGYAFMDCSSLKSVVIGTGLKTISGYIYYSEVRGGLFMNCTKLASVEIKSNVLTSVGDCCFYNCRSLRKIQLPTSVTEIGQRVFEGCTELGNIYMLPTTPPTINANTFPDYATPTLHVPASAVTDYTKADIWKQFANVIGIGSEPKATAEEIAALEALMAEAQTLYNNAVEGNEPGNYRKGAKAALMAVIKDVLARISDNMTTKEVEDCTDQIQTAIKSFKLKQVKNETQKDNIIIFPSSMKAATGAEFRLPIEMTNTDAISGLQFDLYLPAGMTLAEDEYGNAIINLSDRASATRHSVSSQTMSDGALRVVVASSSNTTFTGNNGEILQLVLFPSKSMAPDDYEVTLKNIILTNVSAVRYVAPDVTSIISVSNYTMGDVNDDGHIDVADLSGVVRFILDDAGSNMIFNAADMDGNGVIEINDYSALVNVILTQESSSVKARRSPALLERLVGMSDNGNGELLIELLDNRSFTGLQLDLTLPEGISLMADGVETESAQHGSWSIQRQDGTYRIICASTTNAELREGTVLRLRVEADGHIDGEAVISNVVLSDTKSVRHEAAPARARVSGTTGMAKVGGKELNFSAAGGALTLSATQSQTVRIVAMNGTTVAEVQLAAGRQTTVNLPAGIYLVNNRKVAVCK